MDNGLAAAIAATQEQLGGLFQKPKLTEKLLSKAPFRFLQDIVLAVSASTGFAAGLYSGDELESGAIKDKAAKIAFLDKLVALVGICSGYDIPVRPSKVVAGLEPEGTNALLATLGKCAKSTDLDFDEAVRRVLDGEPPGKRSPPVRSPAPARSAAGRNGGNKGGGGGRTPGSSGGQSEEKHAQNLMGDSGVGVGQGSAGSAPGGSGDGGGGDEKASAKHEMEAMGAAAKAMGAPHSRRVSSRAGVPRAEAKSDNTATAGLGGDPSEGQDLTAAIDACTGEIPVTRQMLEPIISRPKLSDKLLNMPPFRFLHDIVSEVTRQTGFGQGLYSEEELDSSLVKAKPAKMAYLGKLIMLVGNSLNTLVDARPGKIVAGLEAENTNRMLQLLALASLERPDSSRAVAAVLGSEDPVITNQWDSRVNAGGAGIDRNTVPGDQDRQRSPQQLERRELSIPSEAKDSSRDVDNAATGRIRGSPPAPSADEAKVVAGDSGGRLNALAEGKTGHESGPDPEAIRHQGGVRDEDTTADTREGARSMRPRTARRRPPAVRDNVKDLNDKDRAQVTDESRAPPKVSKVSNIMMEGDDDDDKESDSDDEVNEVHGGSRAFPTGGGGGTRGVGDGGAKGEIGHTALVAEILKEKQRAEERAREAEADAKADGQSGQERKETSKGGSGIRMGRLRWPRASSLSSLSASTVPKAGASRSASVGDGGYGDADVAKLMDAIQMLCQGTHPLGKCLDFVHEDLSLMSQEMDRWRALHRVKAEMEEQSPHLSAEIRKCCRYLDERANNYSNNTAPDYKDYDLEAEALKAERATTEAFLQPLRLQLRDLEHQVKESTVKINGVKASISANENKINSLLKLAVTS